MELSELTFQFIVLLIPGGIAAIIFEKLTLHPKWTPFKFVLNAILLGGVTYLIFDLFSNRWGFTYHFWRTVMRMHVPPADVLGIASLMAIPIGFFAALIENLKIVTWIGQKIKFSTKYGEENLFSYFLYDKKVKDIYFRDMENDLLYYGSVRSYSETDSITEILLNDVKVYKNSDVKFLYYAPSIFLSRAKNNIIIDAVLNINNHEQTEQSRAEGPPNDTAAERLEQGSEQT